MVLDIGLPGMDGFTVLRTLRAQACRLPVIVLTARDGVEDTVAGLEGGAGDYMPKPFRFEELLARVRLRLHTDRAETTVLTHGGLQLDLRTRRARVDERTVDLSAREFALAETFLRHPGQVLSREQLLSHVWGYDFDPAPTSSTSTSATCAASSAPTGSPPSAAWATASNYPHPASRAIRQRESGDPAGRTAAPRVRPR